MEREIAWKGYSDEDLLEVEETAADYISFISQNKTERECCAAGIAWAQANGYVSLEDAVAQGCPLEAGDKVYSQVHGKALMLAHIGSAPLTEGMNILGAHIDSPRLDLKQNPLYEADGFTLLDTHYYGGIKHYQWTALPMALHGIVAKKDGETVSIALGEDPEDPVFCVTDLLIHLGKAQMAKDGNTVVEGEDLDLLVGNRPKAGEEKEAVKALTLDLLAEKYDIAEEDFLSAELEVVPAGPAREMGFDRSMIIGYGQDDRVCAYASLAAQFSLDDVLDERELKAPEKTAVCILVDKEEIGSVGATGMASCFFENTVAELIALTGAADYAGGSADLALRRALKSSAMLSSDVSAGYDPAYAAVFEKKNAAFLGKGLVFNKYTGARGKSGSNDARAEYMARVRKVMDDAKVSFQTAELGKVDAGGGGTIAYIPAKYGMDVIDSGVAVLSMHAPWEVTSKADLYEAVKGYRAFQLEM